MIQKIQSLYRSLSTWQKALLWFVIFSLLLQVVFSWYAQKNTLNPVELTQEQLAAPYIQEIAAQEVLIKTPFPQIPEQMPIYSATLFTTQEIHEFFIQKLNLTRHPTLSWYAKNEITGFSSLLDQGIQQVTIARILDQQEVARPLSQDQLVKEAETFITNFDLNVALQPDVAAIQKISHSDSHNPEESSTEEVFYIPFYQKIDGYSALYDIKVEPVVTVFIDPAGRVGEVRFNPLLKEITKQGENPSISTAQLNQAILTLKPSVIVLTENELVVSDLSSFDQIIVNNITIEYRIEPIKNLIVPYFYLTGEAKKRDTSARLEMIYPVSK